MPRYALLILLLVPAAFVPRTAAASDTLKEYDDKCTKAIGEAVPTFDCNSGTLVPTTNASGGSCDRPNVLNGECDPGSYFKVIKNSEKVAIVAMCRKKGNDATQELYGDIAVIQHNKETGATCFYQAPPDRPNPPLSGHVLAPSGIDGKWRWLEPAATAAIGCGECHDNGPILRTPYLSQITGKDALPTGLNAYKAFYKFVGDRLQEMEGVGDHGRRQRLQQVPSHGVEQYQGHVLERSAARRRHLDQVRRHRDLRHAEFQKQHHAALDAAGLDGGEPDRPGLRRGHQGMRGEVPRRRQIPHRLPRLAIRLGLAPVSPT